MISLFRPESVDREVAELLRTADAMKLLKGRAKRSERPFEDRFRVPVNDEVSEVSCSNREERRAIERVGRRNTRMDESIHLVRSIRIAS